MNRAENEIILLLFTVNEQITGISISVKGNKTEKLL